MAENTKPIYGLSQYPHMDLFYWDNPAMDILKVIGDNLTEFMRDSRGLDTCKKVAEKADIGFGTVQRVKNGEINVTVKNLAAIAGALKRHPAEFLIDHSAQSKAQIPDYSMCIDGQSRRLEANEPPAAAIHHFPAPLLSELINIAEKINDDGLNRLIERANQLTESFPRQHKTNDAK